MINPILVEFSNKEISKILVSRELHPLLVNSNNKGRIQLRISLHQTTVTQLVPSTTPLDLELALYYIHLRKQWNLNHR